MQKCISACNPLCGDGETCTNDGRCISACNPACRPGEQCTKQGQCLAPPAPPPPAAAEAPRVTFIPGAPPPRDELSPNENDLSERRRTGKRFHDGFYLRLGVGAGYLVSKVSVADDTSSESSSSDESFGGVQGFTIPMELAIGGSPVPGVVLGAGSWPVHVPSAAYEFGRGDYTKTESASYGSIAMLGPFIDVYPAARAGFHLQAAPCLTLVAPGKSDTLVTDTLSGVGFGGMVGLGYEGWVSDQWGIGILARTQVLSVGLTDESDNEFDYLALTPSLLMTATLQ